MASTLTGLNQRGSRWYINIIVPPDLREVYDRRAMNLALGTSERREGIVRGTVKRAEMLAGFEAKRRELNPEALAVVTPEMAATLAERVRTFILAEDDRVRSDLPLLAEMVHMKAEVDRLAAQPLRIPQWDLPAPRIDDLSGATDEEREELSALNAYLDGQAAIALAGGNVGMVFPMIRQEAARLGVTFDIKTPGAREALIAALKAFRKAHREVTFRDAGEVIDTPEAPAIPKTLAKSKPRTLRDVFDRWKLSGKKDRTADSIAAYERALKQFEGQHPDVRLAGINRDLGNTYQTWLRGQVSITSKTQRDRLNALKSLLKFAAIELEWIPKHPWVGLDIETKTTNPRRAWTDAELKTFFASPLHTAHALPAHRYAGRDAAYWIPLLGLYTGTRLGELCQLRTADVQQADGIWVLVLTDDGEGQKIKSTAGHRSVPIHSDLMRLGFLKYVEAMRKAQSDALWPSLPMREGKPSDYFGRWFREHRKALGIAGARPDFHCFRHTVRPLMRKAGHSEGTMDKVTGHKTMGSVGTVVYDHRTLDEVQEAVEAIRYPALNFKLVAVVVTS